MLTEFCKRNSLMVDAVSPFTGEITALRKSTKDFSKDEASTLMSDMDSVAVEYMGSALPYDPPEAA